MEKSFPDWVSRSEDLENEKISANQGSVSDRSVDSDSEGVFAKVAMNSSSCRACYFGLPQCSGSFEGLNYGRAEPVCSDYDLRAAFFPGNFGAGPLFPCSENCLTSDPSSEDCFAEA